MTVRAATDGEENETGLPMHQKTSEKHVRAVPWSSCSSMAYRRGRSSDMKRISNRKQSGRIDLVAETMFSERECFDMCSLEYSSISTDCCS